MDQHLTSKLKIILGLLLVGGGIFVTNYTFSENVTALTLSFLVISILFLILHGKSTFWKLGNYWLSFAFFLILVFILFHIFQCGIGSNCIFSGGKEGFATALILLNTVYIIEIFILSITINDILALRIPIRYLKFLILLRILMTQSITKFENNGILFNVIPEFQVERKVSIKTIKPLFFQKIILVITILFYLLEQGEVLGLLIDNRINHTYTE